MGLLEHLQHALAFAVREQRTFLIYLIGMAIEEAGGSSAKEPPSESDVTKH